MQKADSNTAKHAFLKLLNDENLAAASTYDSNTEVFDIAINAWNISSVARYFKAPSSAHVLAISYRVQVDKANFLVIANVLRRHYSAALSHLRMAIDNSTISFGIFHSPDDYIDLIKQHKDTKKLDDSIKKLSNRIFKNHSVALNNDVKSLKGMLSSFGPHPSYGHLGSNVSIDTEASAMTLNIFDRRRTEYEVGILGCMLHEITFFHDALMHLDEKMRTDLVKEISVHEMNNIKLSIDKMKRDNLPLFIKLFSQN